MLRLASRAGGSVVHFRRSVVSHDAKRRRTLTLKAVCGPDDDGSPCLRIMLPDED
jgi:hypothetical protein